jgi:hypothetical protein
MKKYSVVIVLSGLLFSHVVLAQNTQEPAKPDPPQIEMQRLDLQKHRVDLQAHEDEVNYQRQVRRLQLEKQRVELDQQRAGIERPQERARKPMGSCPMHCWRGIGLMLIACLVLHILLTVWVYQDIRKRNTGSGIWIVVTLIAGFAGALLYALVRLGDKPT